MDSIQALRDALDAVVAELVAAARQDPRLAREYEQSLPEFFRGSPTPADPRTALLAARRHAEWFLLERISPTSDAAPLEDLLQAQEESDASEASALAPVLRASFAGIFRVSALSPGEGLMLDDMAGLGSYACSEAEAAESLTVGDLIVGRLHPIGEELHMLSPAAGFVRDPKLAQAVEHDLDRMREERVGRVLRISQLEIERLFFGAGASATEAPADADPIAEARDFLLRSGVEAARVERSLARLAATPRDDARWAHGAGDALGEVLTELAFDTDVDLDGARLALLKAWTALRAPTSLQAPPRETAPEKDARSALADFEAKRQSGADLEQAFAELERDLGLVGESEGEGEEGEELEFPSVLPALIEEFFWERSQGADSRTPSDGMRRQLALLTNYGAELDTIEDLDERSLLRFLTFWIWEHDALEQTDDATALIDTLEPFCQWLETAHDMPVWTSLRPTLASLRKTLPRITRANLARPRDHGLSEEVLGEVFEITSIDADGRTGIMSRDGRSTTTHFPRAVAEHLAPGDRLRLHEQEQEAVLLCCYPPEIAELFSA